MRVIHWKSLSKPLYLSPSRIDLIIVPTEPCQVAPCGIKKKTQIHSYNYTPKPMQNLNSRSLTRNPKQGYLTGRAGGQHLTN
jgi:hypothetical protein